MQPEDPIVIEGKSYDFDDLPPRAQQMVMFLQSIDNNLTTLDTQMQMMQITREGCYSRLTTAVKDHEQEQERRFQEDPPF
jgi:hypothetical protein